MNTINRKYQILAISLIAGLLLNQTSFTNLTSALTYQNSVDVKFTINPTLSINLSANDLIINNLTPGSSSDSNIITVDVATNAGFGYYMSATAGTSTTNTNLTNNTNSGSIFTNLASNAATLGAFPDNYWGYSYSTDNGSTWISGSQGSTAAGYNGLPLDNDDDGATGVILASTNSLTNAGSVKFKIGAKAATTQASGTYTNTINFYAVANPEPPLNPVPCNPGKICYNVNSLTTTEGTMGEQDAPADGNTVMLLASNFSRQGYGFAGWSDTYYYGGNLYGPQETITVPTGTAANGLSLYAIWIESAGSMQSDAASVCNGLTPASNATRTLSSVSALTDQRDGDTYAIAKLADGKCWMIENLRLDDDADHNSDGSLAQGYGTSTPYFGAFGGLANAENTNFESSTANSLYYSGTQSGTASIDIGTVNNPERRMPRYNNINTTNRAANPTSNTFASSSTAGAMYSYGNYYTWHAAIADVASYGKNRGATSTSICPSGWKLPAGGFAATENTFGDLSVALGGPAGGSTADSSSTPTGTVMLSIFRSFPNNFLYSGLFSNTASLRGSSGHYWGSYSASDDAYALILQMSSTYLRPGSSGYMKYSGSSIRCIVGP